MNKMKKKYEVPLVRVVEMEAMVIMAGSGDEVKVEPTTDSDGDSTPTLNWGGHIPWRRRTARLTVKDEKDKDYEEVIEEKSPAARGDPLLHPAGKCL